MSLDQASTRRKPRTIAPLPVYAGDDEVLTFREWCVLNRISPRTGRRVLKAPGAPTVTQLSPQRIGITRGNNRRWQESRARAIHADI